MFLHRINMACALLVLIGLVMGCSGGGSPVEPEGNISQPSDLPTGEIREGTEYSPTHVSFGVYEIHLDAVNMTVETSMKRGLQWHINLLAFLLPPFCPNNDCMVIDNFDVWDLPNSFQFDGILKHPFGGDPNLDGFDVRAIAILKPNESFPSGNVPVGVILNADGYTNLWNESTLVPLSDINPFRAYWTNSTMRRFENGKTAVRKFIIQFPSGGGEFAFDIAIDASFEFPELVDPDDPSTSPNIWEPYEITGTLTEPLEETAGSDALLEITLFDWQENPGPVSIESPDLFPGSISAGNWIDHIGYSFSYEVMLPNTLGATLGQYPVLLKVVDSFDISVPDLDLITFHILDVDVVPHSGPLPPVALAHADVHDAFTGEEVFFDASDSYDPDGEISAYLWDVNGDGSFGEKTGATTSYIYTEPGLYNVDVQVFDFDGLWDTLDQKIALTIMETPNDAPVAIATSNTLHTSVGGYVKFYGDQSFDPDGVITTYAWDLNNNDIYGMDEDESDMNPVHQFLLGGTYYVWLRVEDNFGAWDETNFPLVIDVSGANVPPISSGTVSCTDPLPNKVLTFTSTSDDPDGFIIKWEWDFDDGNGWVDYTSTEGEAGFAFDTVGTYNVDLRVTDSADVTDTLDTLIVINVGDGGFTPPTPQDCSGAIGNHVYHLDLELTNDHSTTFDVCATPSGNWLYASFGKLVEVDTWGTIVNANFHTLLGDGPWLLSLDYDDVNSRYAYIYSHIVNPTQVQIIDSSGTPVAVVNPDENIRAVCFDWEGNLWVLTASLDVRVFLADDSFNEDYCLGYSADVGIEGRVYDMALNFYNHSLYIFSQGADGLGQLVGLDATGALGGNVTPVFDAFTVGPSNSGDIIIDNSGDPGTSDCRISLFSGDSACGVARFDSELNVIAQSAYSFWGCKAAALTPTTVIVLEACCGGYFDRYLAPADW